MTVSIYSDKYQASVDFEVVRELINNELAHHFSQVYALGETTKLGALHLQSARALKELRNSLDVDDPDTVRVASLALDVLRADREQLATLIETPKNASAKGKAPAKRTVGTPHPAIA